MKFKALVSFASNFLSANKGEIIEIKDCKNYCKLGELLRAGYIKQIEGQMLMGEHIRAEREKLKNKK